MLCGFENTKNTCYTEVTRTSKIFKIIFKSLIFNTSFTENLEFRNQKFHLVRLFRYFCVSSIWLDCQIQSNAIHELN